MDQLNFGKPTQMHNSRKIFILSSQFVNVGEEGCSLFAARSSLAYCFNALRIFQEP
jgi:hypothetical protein